eukprot:350844-Chlamydomonas_euryale.AAC.2
MPQTHSAFAAAPAAPPAAMVKGRVRVPQAQPASAAHTHTYTHTHTPPRPPQQVKGEYACRKPNLRPLHEEATFLLGQLAVDSARVQHVLRNANARADELANEAIDARPAPRIDCVYVCARQGA